MDQENRPFARLEDMSPNRKPRIGLMGEFSAGKSTLSNLLVGGNALPVQVTATQLPPVWISGGAGQPFLVDTSDDRHDVDIQNLVGIDVEGTKYLRFFRDSDLLELCDLIDMPGISDPNMSSDVWERVLPYVDMVIWCTHATQAWRQSEAAVWSNVPDILREKSILLLTRMDKIIKDSDRIRVVNRVKKEVTGQFGAMFPVSLLQAIEAGDDREKWDASGAEAFTTHLVDTLLGFQGDAGKERLARAASRPPAEEGAGLQVRKGPDPRMVTPRRVAKKEPVTVRAKRPDSSEKAAPLRLY